MRVIASLIDGTDDSRDREIYSVTMEVPDDTDPEMLAGALTADFYKKTIGSTPEEFQKKNEKAFNSVTFNFCHWVNVLPVNEVLTSKEEFIDGAFNSMLNYGYPTSAQEILEEYL